MAAEAQGDTVMMAGLEAGDPVAEGMVAAVEVETTDVEAEAAAVPRGAKVRGRWRQFVRLTSSR